MGRKSVSLLLIASEAVIFPPSFWKFSRNTAASASA
jgi:hypothetical protein